MTDSFDNMIGKQLESVALSEGNTKIVFKFQDGFERAFGVEGDCCSSSWIEHLEAPDDVQGATLLSVEESGGVPYDDHKCVGYDWEKSEAENKAAGYCGHDVLAVYSTRFRTNRGDIVLEYRNDSNGYYGGYLVDA